MVKIILAFAITCALIICSIQLISAFKCKDVLFSIVVIIGVGALAVLLLTMLVVLF